MQVTRARYRVMLAVVGVIGLAVLAGVVVLWPRGALPGPGAGGQADSTQLASATLTKVARLDCPEADPGVPGSVCIKVAARLAGGRQVSFDTHDPACTTSPPRRPGARQVSFAPPAPTGGMFRAGQRVRLAVAEQPGQPASYN